MSGLLWPDLEPQAVAEGWLADVESGMTSIEVLAALALRHSDEGVAGMPGRWVFLREVQTSTGAYGDEQRFDAVAIGLVPSTGWARVIYEVKVSRSDWLRERKAQRWARGASFYEPQAKWQAALNLSTEMWFAAPPHCILPSEVPEHCGLIEIRPWGESRELRARAVVKAPIRETPIPGPGFWASALRRAARR